MVESSVNPGVPPIEVETVTTNMGESTMSQAGFLDTAKEKLSPQALMDKISNNKDLLMLMGLYVLAGFVAGFVLKKCNKFIFFIALAVGVVLFLQYQGYLSVIVNWDQVQKVVGIEPVAVPGENMISVYWQWIKDHISLVVSFSVGFALGLRIG